MTSRFHDSNPTTRRRFVLDVVGGLAGTALLPGCGGSAEVTHARTGGDGGAGGSGGTPGTGGAPDSGSGTGGVADGGSATGTGGASTGGASTSGSGGASGSGTGGAPGGEAGTCAMYPQQTEGPFYLDLDLLRGDITEGKPGAPLDLELQVVRANGCTPVANAVVDVWQCDADGVYAGFPGQLGGVDTSGQKFLRGSQITGSDGRVVFRTIYPGWYPGRTTHIHFKVHPSATTEMTSQMYFPEDVTAEVYRTGSYAARGQKDTSNLADSIAQSGGMPPVLLVTQSGSVQKATLVISVLG